MPTCVPLTVSMMHRATFGGGEGGAARVDGRIVSRVTFVGGVRLIEAVEHPGYDDFFYIEDGTGVIRVLKGDRTTLWKIERKGGTCVEGGNREWHQYVLVIGRLTTDGAESIVEAEHIRRIFDIDAVVGHFRLVFFEVERYHQSLQNGSVGTDSCESSN